MNIIAQVATYLPSTPVSEVNDMTSPSSPIDFLSDLSGTIQNIWWIILLIFTVLVLIVSLFSIGSKATKFTCEQINHLTKDGKYIPGVFVELNGSKEILRYFIHRKSWKKRLVEKFNLVYDNAYGDILKKAYRNPAMFYKLNTTYSLKKIEKATKAAFDFHSNFSISNVEFESNYQESQYLFDILRYCYTDTLGDIYQRSKATNRRYFILTGSAGNGKTNLLCSISELLINLKECVVFLNARDIEGDILSFLLYKLKLPKLYTDHKNLYLFMVNLLLTIWGKHFFIIIDAVNENDSDGFACRITKFISEISRFSRINVIVSCRNEYYKERFRKHLVENVDIPAFEFDLKEQHYTLAGIKQMIRAYSKFFNYTGQIAFNVQNMLSKQLLLLRIFFEVNKDSNTDVFTIRKHEIFAKYIEMVKQACGEYIVQILDTVTDFMIETQNYDEISFSDLKRLGISSAVIKKAVDSSILLSKKLISHEGTIAKSETEVLYFVFDELRDYYVARRILLKNISEETVNCQAVLEKLKQLRAIGASCEEGVIHYCYIFFRTDEVVNKLNQTEKMCNAILDLYRLSESTGKKSYSHVRHREEFQNLGLRIILTSGIELSDFEIAYIQDCLRKKPYEDGGIFFDTMLDGTLYGGIYNLNIYLRILFGLKNRDAILKVLREISVRNGRDNRFFPEDLVKHYVALDNLENKSQIQQIAELYLLCFRFDDTEAQEKLEGFFYNLPTHDVVQREMIFKMREACSLEVFNNE